MEQYTFHSASHNATYILSSTMGMHAKMTLSKLQFSDDFFT